MTANLLILMSDEHQARAMGCAGHKFVQTPNLDALAARGVRFTNAYTPSPICVPARASFATGLPVHQTRMWDNAMPYDGSIPGWGHTLQRHNILVESIGKLHYRAEEDPVGFDLEHLPMMVADGVGMVWASIRREDERVGRRGRMLGNYIGPGESAYTRYDAAITDRAVEWLRSRGTDKHARPWCLFVGFVAPHFPLVVPRQFYDLYPPDSLPEPKLHPGTGYRRHPWVERQNAFMDTEAAFRDAEERRKAMSGYFGLCTWLDRNIGLLLSALGDSGLCESTTVIYTSDHGDNVGARGLWGKSNLYEESVAIPLIMTGPGIVAGTCDTPVSLLDVSATIPAHFGLEFAADHDSRPLSEIVAGQPDPSRPVLSQYHAAGAVSGAYMLRIGRWKYNLYVGFEPELFDLQNDPEELSDLAGNPEYRDILDRMDAELRMRLDPEAENSRAFADQDALIGSHGGREAALELGATGATPPPAAVGEVAVR